MALLLGTMCKGPRVLMSNLEGTSFEREAQTSDSSFCRLRCCLHVQCTHASTHLLVCAMILWKLQHRKCTWTEIHILMETTKWLLTIPNSVSTAAGGEWVRFRHCYRSLSIEFWHQNHMTNSATVESAIDDSLEFVSWRMSNVRKSQLKQCSQSHRRI